MPGRSVEVIEREGGVEAVARKRGVLGAVGMAQRLGGAFLALVAGLVMALMIGPFALTGQAWCPPGATCTFSGDLPRPLAVALLAVGVLLLCGAGFATVVAFFHARGREFVRVDASGVTHGYLWKGRGWLRSRYGPEKIDGLETSRGWRAELVGTKAGRRVATWLVGAAPADLESAAAQLSAALPGPPEAGDLPARVQVARAGDGIELTLAKTRWSQLAAWAVVCVVPLTWLATLTARSSVAWTIVWYVPLVGIPAWITMLGQGPFRTRVRIVGDRFVVRRGPLRREVRLQSEPRIEVDARDLWLVDGKRRTRLGFERLSRQERIEARAAVARIAREQWSNAARSGSARPTPAA